MISIDYDTLLCPPPRHIVFFPWATSPRYPFRSVNSVKMMFYYFGGNNLVWMPRNAIQGPHVTLSLTFYRRISLRAWCYRGFPIDRLVNCFTGAFHVIRGKSWMSRDAIQIRDVPFWPRRTGARAILVRCLCNPSRGVSDVLPVGVRVLPCGSWGVSKTNIDIDVMCVRPSDQIPLSKTNLTHSPPPTPPVERPSHNYCLVFIPQRMINN